MIRRHRLCSHGTKLPETSGASCFRQQLGSRGTRGRAALPQQGRAAVRPVPAVTLAVPALRFCAAACCSLLLLAPSRII